MKANPFFELYVGDRISAQEYVELFSPELVPHTEALFLPGNIVVTGIQGSGKSMLLSLLKPAIRLKFEESETNFPVPKALRKFVSCSVNLAHSSAIDFGYRSEIDRDVQKTELLFGDFLNYLLVDSLLATLLTYGNASDRIRGEVGLQSKATELDEVARDLSELEVWEGWLGSCESIDQVKKRLRDRVRLYRRFLHGKDRELSPDVFDTSTAVGQPLETVARCLKDTGILQEDTNVFADIDQYEELGNISSRNTPGKDVDYRAVINKALASRKPEISYRIGTRGYSWKRHGKVHGTSGNLEGSRDYKYIDLDAILRKGENESSRTNDVFKEFAVDVFRRRIKFAGYRVDNEPDGLLEAVYGKEIIAREKVNNYFGLRDKASYIDCEPEWSEATKKLLKSLATRDFFSAKLGEVYLRQKGDEEIKNPRDSALPWESRSNAWWRKERIQALMLQIASRTRQKAIWGGEKDIVDLSGGSILAFLGINQFIWSAWLQKSKAVTVGDSDVPFISVATQSTGIVKASEAWIESIPEQTGKSGERQRFIKSVAAFLREKILQDKRLSYPGATGFSVKESDLEEHDEVASFLEELSDYGNMLSGPHTSKDRPKQRTKFYFHPIYCPALKLPYGRTKEPYYAKVKEVAQWIYGTGFKISLGRDDQAKQTDLFKSP